MPTTPPTSPPGAAVPDGTCTRCGAPAGRCRDCVSCDRCGDLTAAGYTVRTVRGSTICEDCRDRWYWQCASCAGWNRDGDDCGNDCTTDCDCGDCSDCDEVDGVIHDYSYRPMPEFHGRGPLYLGPEIEVETPAAERYRCAEYAARTLGDLGYLKDDGSLESGFEIVTHPMSYDWALAHFPWQLLSDLAGRGCDTPERTGIHVHVSRAGFTSTCHTYRWMKFIYRNETDVVRLARRRSDGWAAFTDSDRRAVKHYAKGAAGDRYRAINTNNRTTYELRVFAGSLNPGQVQAALAFAAASVDYTRTLTVQQIAAGGWSWPAFTAWVADRNLYQPLTAELEALTCAC